MSQVRQLEVRGSTDAQLEGRTHKLDAKDRPSGQVRQLPLGSDVAHNGF